MESDVSDDDSNSPSIDELLDLVHEHQKVIKKQSKEIKNLSALKDLNAFLPTNFEDLMCKFKLLSKEHEECKDRWTKRGGELGLFQILKQSKATLTYAILVGHQFTNRLNKTNYTS